MGLFKNLRRGYRGGPDFAHCEQITRQLENWQLQVTENTRTVMRSKAGRPVFSIIK